MPVTIIPEAMPSTPHDCGDLTSPSQSPPQDLTSTPPASPTRDKVMTRSRSNALSTPSSSPSPTADTDLCTICYLPLSRPHAQRDTPERLAALPCGHAFGHRCLLQWLRVAPAPTCPMCRMDLIHRKCGHPVMPAAVSAAPPFLAMHPAATDNVVVGSAGGKGEGTIVRVGLDQLCILCREPEGLASEMLRFERRKFEAEKKMIERLFQMPMSVEMGTPVREANAVEERIKKMDERWDDAWLSCQDYARLKW